MPIQNPQSKIQNPQNPKSKIPKIQNPQIPKSKIQNPQNPKSSAEIQNLGRWGPHVKNCFLMMQNPKSKIPKIRPKKLGFWILGILDFGFWGFWILDFGILGILDFGILGILDFGFWGFWILDFGILGILDFGDFGFWGGPGDVPLGNLVTVPGGQRLESPLVCLRGPLQNQLQIEHFFRGQNPSKSQKNPDFQTKRSELYKITEKPRLPTHFKTNLDEPSDHTPENRRKLKK